MTLGYIVCDFSINNGIVFLCLFVFFKRATEQCLEGASRRSSNNIREVGRSNLGWGCYGGPVRPGSEELTWDNLGPVYKVSLGASQKYSGFVSKTTWSPGSFYE